MRFKNSLGIALITTLAYIIGILIMINTLDEGLIFLLRLIPFVFFVLIIWTYILHYIKSKYSSIDNITSLILITFILEICMVVITLVISHFVLDSTDPHKNLLEYLVEILFNSSTILFLILIAATLGIATGLLRHKK